MSFNGLPFLFLLHKCMGMYADSLMVDTSKHVRTMVRVAMMKIPIFSSCCQYHFVLVFNILRYSAVAITSPVFMTCLSNILFVL